jgi:ketosteroid isomerase-like protein
MSEENLEIVRRWFAAGNRGGMDAAAEFWHPDINWRAMEGALDDVGVFHGPDAMRRYYEQWEETFEDTRTEIEELIDRGDQAVAVVRGIGRMKGSDAEVDIRFAIVISFRDGKICRGREYATREEALEAAALRE